jgi:hypothetical protein
MSNFTGHHTNRVIILGKKLESRQVPHWYVRTSPAKRFSIHVKVLDEPEAILYGVIT